MSVEDGNRVNKVFTDQQKQIDSLKKIADSANAISKRFQDKHESYLKDQYNKQFQIDTLKVRMEANKRIYERTDRLRLYTIRHATIFNLAIMFLIGFIATAH